jgi:hypothetical protein
VTNSGWSLNPCFVHVVAPTVADGRGPNRAVVNGVLWALRTGASRHDLPRRYPPCRLVIDTSNWGSSPGRLLLQRPAEDLRNSVKIDLSAFVDARFAEAKKGGATVGHTRREKGSKIRAIWDRLRERESSL